MTLMSVSDVAKYLCINKITVYRCIKEGKIQAKKVGGKWIVIKEVLDKDLFDDTLKEEING